MGPKPKWTNENIKIGFEKFLLEHNRLPTANEIDKLDYLPSSRQIQRKFGGLENLREVLGYKETHFGKGRYRSRSVTRTSIRGRNAEIEMERILKRKFGDVFVHTERMFGNFRKRVDFYVYSPDGNFGVEIFYPGTFRDLQKNIDIKVGNYTDFFEKLYFVVANPQLTQQELDRYVQAKKRKKLSSKQKLVTLDNFIKFIETKEVYPNPVKEFSKQ